MRRAITQDHAFLVPAGRSLGLAHMCWCARIADIEGPLSAAGEDGAFLGEGALANGIGSPQRAQSTTK